jgi:hypothetical protein
MYPASVVRGTMDITAPSIPLADLASVRPLR